MWTAQKGSDAIWRSEDLKEKQRGKRGSKPKEKRMSSGFPEPRHSLVIARIKEADLVVPGGTVSWLFPDLASPK